MNENIQKLFAVRAAMVEVGKARSHIKAAHLSVEMVDIVNALYQKEKELMNMAAQIRKELSEKELEFVQALIDKENAK